MERCFDILCNFLYNLMGWPDQPLQERYSRYLSWPQNKLSGGVREMREHTYCIDCGIEIRTKQAKRCRSCNNKKMWVDGVLGTEEHLSKVGRRVGDPKPLTYCVDCGVRVSQTSCRCNSCASKNDWAEGKYTEERNLKVGKSSKQRWEEGVYDDPEVKARQSAGVSAAWERGVYDEEWHEGQSERIKEAWARGDFDDRTYGMKSPTSPERCLMEILDERGITYEFQFPIRSKRYDFFLPEHNLIIEYDSYYWHSTPEQVANDEYKDALAGNVGIELIRLKGSPKKELARDEMISVLEDKILN